MRNNLEMHPKNKSVRVQRWSGGFAVEVYGPMVSPFASGEGLRTWVRVANRSNIKEARIVRDCFGAIVEDMRAK